MKNGDETAFPVEGGNHNFGTPFPGMTKREYFAGRAMQAYISGHLSWTDGADGGSAMADPKEAAKEAVAYADELLAELDK